MSGSRTIISISISGIIFSSLCLNPAVAANKDSDKKSTPGLSATITKTDFNDGINTELNKLTDDALERSDNAAEADRLVKKYRSGRQKALAKGKEFVYSMAEIRGFGPSKEGANVLLEKVSKIKSLAGAEYIKQRIEDKTHTQIVQSTLQIAMALDTSDPDSRQRLLDKGYAKLKELAGQDNARKTLETLTAWSKSLEVPEQAFKQPTWDVDQFQDNLHNCTAMATHSDPVVKSVVKKIGKYNRSKATVALSSVVETSTDVATLLAPGFAIPAAVQMAQSAFVTSTGGTEETKLVTEVYYAKSLESRWKRLNEENQLALTNYQTALRSKSPTLMACSEAVLQNLIGADRVQKVLGQTVLANVNLKLDLPIETSQTPLIANKGSSESPTSENGSGEQTERSHHGHADRAAQRHSSHSRISKHSHDDKSLSSAKALDIDLEQKTGAIDKDSDTSASNSDEESQRKSSRHDTRKKHDAPLTTADAKTRKSDFTPKIDDTIHAALPAPGSSQRSEESADRSNPANPGDTSEFWSSSSTDK